MAAAALTLYLIAVALLPWSTIPRFPWLHEHAQWSDAVFAAATALWVLERWRARAWPQPRPVHVAMALYLAFAATSLIASEPRPPSGPAKLLGMAELVALAVVTSDIVSRERTPALLARVVAGTALATAVAALAGVALFFLGIPTWLVGDYGDLLPGPYARAQAGLPHPNLLASFCLFAASVVGREDARLPGPLQRAVQAALWLTVILTFSRGILAFGLAALVRGATTAARRRLTTAYAIAAAAILAALTAWNLALDPTRPWAAQLRQGPSSRVQGLVSSLETLAEHPLLGAGPGNAAGRKEGARFDAHITPLNVAATLGLPAFAAFVAIPILLWRSRARPADRATWGALAGVGLDALTEDVEDFRHVWILFGLADAGRARVSGRAVLHRAAHERDPRTSPRSP